MLGWRSRGYLSGGSRPPAPTTATPTGSTGNTIGVPPLTKPGNPAACPPPPCPATISPPPVQQPPTTQPPSTVARVRLMDLFYSEIPTGDISYFLREGRVPFSAIGRADDGSGTILSCRVPDAQTLVISDVEFYAQRPNGTNANDQLLVDERQLTGFIGVHVLVDDRSPVDLYTDIELSPTEFPGTQPLRASAFSRFGTVFGGAERQPHVFLRAREGQTLRLAYTVFNLPGVPITNIGAVARGYVIPSAILTAKTAS